MNEPKKSPFTEEQEDLFCLALKQAASSIERSLVPALRKEIAIGLLVVPYDSSDEDTKPQGAHFFRFRPNTLLGFELMLGAVVEGGTFLLTEISSMRNELTSTVKAMNKREISLVEYRAVATQFHAIARRVAPTAEVEQALTRLFQEIWSDPDIGPRDALAKMANILAVGLTWDNWPVGMKGDEKE